MLTIFTTDYGIIKAAAHGAKRNKSRQAAASQFLCLSEFVLYKGNSDIFNVNSIEPIDSFYPIQEDIIKLSLGTYFADVLYHTIELANPDVRLLRLFLNTLYIMAYKDIPCELVKTVFELRCMTLGGFMPVLNQCTSCLKEERLLYFRVSTGGVICSDCRHGSDYLIDKQMLTLMKYVIYADDKKIFSFSVPDDVAVRTSNLTEKYVAYQIDRTCTSLDYYKKIRI